MKLTAVREQLAADIDAVTSADVAVTAYYPDQITVPAVIVGWGAPWLARAGACKWDATLDVLLLAGRMDAAGAFDTLDVLAEQVLPLTNTAQWRFSFMESPAPVDIGGITYLAARLSVETTVNEKD